MTPNLFDAWQLRTVAGRVLRPEEDVPGGPCSIVLSHKLWVSHFQRDPAAAHAVGERGRPRVHDRRRARSVNRVRKPVAHRRLDADRGGSGGRPPRRSPLLGHRPSEAGRDARAGRRRNPHDHRASGQGVSRDERRLERARGADEGGDRRQRHMGHPRAAVARRRVRAPHRVRQRDQPRAGARVGPAARAGGQDGAWSVPMADAASPARRRPRARRRGRRTGPRRRRCGASADSRGRVRAVLRADQDRSERAAVCGGRVDPLPDSLQPDPRAPDLGQSGQRGAQGRRAHLWRGPRAAEPSRARRRAGRAGDDAPRGRDAGRAIDDRDQSHRHRLRSAPAADRPDRHARVEAPR